ncbi:MAG: hypothetical protein J0H00_12980 [Burkholderiales bacterium]|nr:hypothetical protein [Burkholderiales bacterium]OJX03796.1 MAG: hypothetical protein BGO72_02595 [Burkholderiales bacterium 70-64]
MNQATNTLAPSYTNSLVQTEAASSFLSLAATETGRKAFLGDPEKFDSGVGPDLTNAHIALRDGVETIGRLLQDPTRNDVQRHEVAGVVAARTIEVLEKSKAAIERRAEVLYGDGVAQAEREFAPRASHAALESEIRAYIREQAKEPDGPVKVRAAMLESKDVAAVIYHSPGFLVGLNDATHSKLRFEATERWVPDAYKRMTDSIALSELTPKFIKAIGSIRASFYNPTLAAKAKLRVQI